MDFFSTPKRCSQNVYNKMGFLSVNTEGKSPAYPTAKNRKQKPIRAARLRNHLTLVEPYCWSLITASENQRSACSNLSWASSFFVSIPNTFKKIDASFAKISGLYFPSLFLHLLN